MELFTSDQHFRHRNILKYQAETRPYQNIFEMNAAYINAWNEDATADDTVYHLGDLCFGSLAQVQEIIELLNGRIVLIPGNHDRWLREYDGAKEKNPEFNLLSKSGHPLEVRWNQIQEVTVEGERIILCHYPMRSWNASYHGSWHLYGHVHKKLEPWGMSMDVGVDSHEGHLVTMAMVRAYMEERKKYLDTLWNKKDGATAEGQ